MTPEGVGRVVGVNALKETVNVQLESEAVIEVSAADLREPGPEAPAEAASAAELGDGEPEDA